jgi:TATA-binding protein-associated factor
LDLQNRSAVAVAAFIEFCVESNIVQPPDKIVKNLCTFLCQDVDQTPTFAYLRKITDGILSFRGSDSTPQDINKSINGGLDPTNSEKSQDADKARIARRGACQAFDQLSIRFGSRLFDVLPSMWQSMAGGLLSACQAGRRFVKFKGRCLTVFQTLPNSLTFSSKNSTARM